MPTLSPGYTRVAGMTLKPPAKLTGTYNSGSTALVAGQPLFGDPVQDDGFCGYIGYPNIAAYFMGVMVEPLAAATQGNNIVLTEGQAYVRFKNHASAVVGTWVRPLPGSSTTGGWFTYSATDTGILLETDQSSGTALHGLEEGTSAPRIRILPGAQAELYKRYIYTAPPIADTDYFIDGGVMSPAAGGTISGTDLTGSVPTYPRNWTVVPSGATFTDIAVAAFTVNGTSVEGSAISEVGSFATNNATDAPITGALAFATVTSFVWAGTHDGATAVIDVGMGDKLGMLTMRAQRTAKRSYINGTLEGTAATFVADIDEVEKNTVDPNSAHGGTQEDYLMGA